MESTSHIMDISKNISPYFIMDDSESQVNTSGHMNVADAAWDKDVRIIVLWVQIAVGIIGGLVVISWLWINRRRKSRVNVIFMQVTLADLLVMVASLCQVQYVIICQFKLFDQIDFNQFFIFFI